MKISYATTYDALDVHNWSGLGYMIAKALEGQNHELDYIGNLQAESNAGMFLNKLYYKIMGKDFDFGIEPYRARSYARQIKASIKPDTDVIFSPGSVPLSLLESNKPKVFYTDATFAGMIGFYKDFSNLSPVSIKHGNELERKALESSQLAIYSSDWAATTAIANYGVSPSKVKVVPFGSNVESKRDLMQVKALSLLRSTSECNLLFLAVDWNRKGGDVAVGVTKRLNEMGVKTTLHVAGVREIPLKELPPYVKNYGFISKSSEQGKRLIDELLSLCHFLFLPTKADCTPVVFSEANSFGLPCIATDVGGIPTIIKEDVNGRAFPLSANENEYADYIMSVYQDRTRYNQLALSSFYEYEHRLNWDVAARTITGLLQDL